MYKSLLNVNGDGDCPPMNTPLVDEATDAPLPPALDKLPKSIAFTS